MSRQIGVGFPVGAKMLEQVGIPLNEFLDLRQPLQVEADHVLEIVLGGIIVLQSQEGPAPIKAGARIVIVQADGDFIRCNSLLILLWFMGLMSFAYCVRLMRSFEKSWELGFSGKVFCHSVIIWVSCFTLSGCSFLRLSFSSGSATRS